MNLYFPKTQHEPKNLYQFQHSIYVHTFSITSPVAITLASNVTATSGLPTVTLSKLFVSNFNPWILCIFKNRFLTFLIELGSACLNELRVEFIILKNIVSGSYDWWNVIIVKKKALLARNSSSSVINRSNLCRYLLNIFDWKTFGI